jgi:hypothetical protein
MHYIKAIIANIICSFFAFSVLADVKKESVIQAAPWAEDSEPETLPEGWQKHTAEENTVVDYMGKKITIPKGTQYFTFNGKVAIGFHGSYNPPRGM